jgi:hypothetical protein
MDPNLFQLDYGRLGEVLTAIVALAFFLERALAILFEHRVFATRFGGSGLKAPIAFIVALGICRQWHFDAISMTILADQTNFFGYAITAAVIAGGSKASVKLFHDVFNTMSDAERFRKQFAGANDRRQPHRADPSPAPALVPEGAN